jgi:uncharacterized small protein (DUF1192 family)
LIDDQSQGRHQVPQKQEHLRMSNDNSLSRPELDDRIAILQDNLRQLVEQAAGRSGGQTEERTADRIAQQREELDRLTEERDARLTK